MFFDIIISEYLKEALMKKTGFSETALLIFMILAVSIIGYTKEQKVDSSWVAVPVKIDGSANDWAEDVLAFEKKVKVDLAFKNDPEYLYVVFMFKDPKYLSSISFTGMTLWFNTEGKKKKDYGVKFINKQVTAEEYISIAEQQFGPIPDKKKSEIREKPNYVINYAEVINKKSKSSSQAPEDAKIRPAIFRSGRQEKMMVYEFAIPLKRVTEQAAGIGTEPGKTIKVGFEWGGTTKEMMMQQLKQTSSGSARARAGSATSGIKDERSGGRQTTTRIRRQRKYSFWVDVQLAVNQ